ncbi:hypothetical protein [Mycoplasmopsis bovirhinis]|nr:hypothetical protein [Mycoplasmopsis bovirhinis]
MIKKTLVGLSMILIPFTAFACTVNNEELVNPDSFNDIDGKKVKNFKRD